METSYNGTKLSWGAKISQSFGNAGTNLLMYMNSYFLLYVYTDVIQIPVAAATVLMLVARVWDAVNDPMMGLLVEKTKSKEGSCRFWLKYFSFPAAIIITLSFWCPEMATPGKIAWVSITYILQGMINTVLGVSGNALVTKMTDDSHERIVIQQIETIFDTGLSALVPAITFPMVEFFGKGNVTKGFLFAMGIYSIFYALFKYASYVGSKGFDTPYVEAVAEAVQEGKSSASDMSIIELLKAVGKNKYAVVTCTIYLFYLLLASFEGTSLVYYFQYVKHDTGLLGVFSTAGAIGGFLSAFILGWLNKKFGNSRSCAYLALAYLICEVVRWVTHDDSAILRWVVFFVTGLGAMAIGAFCYQCVMDACTYGKLKNGIDNPAVTMSVFSFASKAGVAVGGMIVSGMMTLVPYVPQAEEQVQSVLTLFRWQNIMLPLICCVVLVVGFYFVVAKWEDELNDLKRASGITEGETENADLEDTAV